MPIENETSILREAMKRLAIAASVAVLIAVVTSCIVFVDETECVISERLGKISAVYDREQDRGIHFKLPWPFEVVRRFDRRTQLFDPYGREVFTKDKKNITVDTFVCWKIAEPNAESAELSSRPVVRFFRALGSTELAESRLDSRVRSILSTQIGQVELDKLFQIQDSEAGLLNREDGLLKKLSNSVRDLVIQRPSETESIEERLGIEIVDVRIKRLNFPSGNQQAVFERMKSERQKIAERYRSAGSAESQVIRSNADRQYNEILARAKADAERIRGEADAESIAILNAAHSQDRQLYHTLRTLDSYEKIINERTTLVLSADSNLLKLLTDGLGELNTVPRSSVDKRSTDASSVRPPLRPNEANSTSAEESGP